MERFEELKQSVKWEIQSIEGNIRILERLQAKELEDKEKFEAESRFIRAEIHRESASWYGAKIEVYKEEKKALERIISRYE